MKDEHHPPLESTIQSSPQRITWRKCANIVMGVMVLGLISSIIGGFNTIWLKPPLLKYTLTIYLILIPAWLVVLVVCGLLRPTGGWKIPVLLVGLGLGQILICLTVIGPAVGSTALLFADDITCETQQLPHQRIRYICTVKDVVDSFPNTYVFEGATLSPFVKLVEEEKIF